MSSEENVVTYDISELNYAIFPNELGEKNINDTIILWFGISPKTNVVMTPNIIVAIPNPIGLTLQYELKYS